MASFDVVSKLDPQTLDNAINVAKKEILNRFDFRDSKSSVDLDKKSNVIHIVTENTMRMDAIIDAIVTRMAKQGLDARSLDRGKDEYASGSMIKKDIKVKTGIDKETAKKMVKDIKDSKLKVSAAIMDDTLRVTGKKIDDLQSVIALLKSKNYELALQFTNMKS
ncbi:YajQ family cyclic di-GMP-binding protein [Cytophagaceae bacterium ABcell3]|nr:YajQ family cyclic di-GMP-binding protein [Cytophagaceae bacterium ABcell3]